MCSRLIEKVPIFACGSEVLGVEERHIEDVTVADDVVKESEEDVLALLAAENFLEHVVVGEACVNASGV